MPFPSFLLNLRLPTLLRSPNPHSLPRPPHLLQPSDNHTAPTNRHGCKLSPRAILQCHCPLFPLPLNRTIHPHHPALSPQLDLTSHWWAFPLHHCHYRSQLCHLSPTVSLLVRSAVMRWWWCSITRLQLPRPHLVLEAPRRHQAEAPRYMDPCMDTVMDIAQGRGEGLGVREVTRIRTWGWTWHPRRWMLRRMGGRGRGLRDVNADDYR